MYQDNNIHINNEKFKKYFFYGIENKEEIKESILYFSSKKVYQKHSLKDMYEIPNEQLENEILQEACKKYKQFYRFVTLNDINGNYTYNVNIEEIEQEMKDEMQLLKKDKRVINTKAGIFFARERTARLEGGQYYVYGKGLVGEKSWTKEIYEILEGLGKLEKENKDEYYQCWLLTKWSRAVDRSDQEEAKKVKDIFNNVKQQADKSER
jgi:hypothetical protein